MPWMATGSGARARTFPSASRGAVRGRAPRWCVVAASLLLVTACTSDDPVQERRAAPGHDELAAAIAEFGEPFYDFDELRAVVVADETDVTFEEYYETRKLWPAGSLERLDALRASRNG